MSVGKKPRKPLPRYTRLRSSGRPRPRSRSASETERIYGTDAHREWMQAQPCLCGCGRGPCDVAHVKNGGMGRKADARFTVPLFRACHRQQHQIGIRAFEELHASALLGRTLEEWAGAFAAAWMMGEDARAIVTATRPKGAAHISTVLPSVLAELLRRGGE